MKIKTALISVYYKDNLEKLVRFLNENDVKIISTGKTQEYIKKLGIDVIPIEQITGFPESFGGRIKTINPLIEGGILFRRNNSNDLQEIKNLKEKNIEIKPIDLVVVNLYPFKKTVLNKDCKINDAIEQIDIGGSTLIRSAAKNHLDVLTVVDPNDYDLVIDDLLKNQFIASKTLKEKMMVKAFLTSAKYEIQIYDYFEKQYLNQNFKENIFLDLEKKQELRYGENPHQNAGLYKTKDNGLVDSKVFFTKKNMSYNNYFDASSALSLIRELKQTPAAIIIKHSNPCGGASAKTILEACKKALKTDPLSAFGGVYAFSRPLDEDTAIFLKDKFIDMILTPGVTSDEVLDILQKKQNRRIVDISLNLDLKDEKLLFKQIDGGFLVQDNDLKLLDEDKLEVVTEKKPTKNEYDASLFALKFCKHTKSNALTYAKFEDGFGQLLAVGAGQMSRVDCSRIAKLKAKDVNFSLKDSSMASDAFFPFPDTVENAAEDGVSCIIQPGGSLKDNLVIKRANELGVSMILSHIRHFKH